MLWVSYGKLSQDGIKGMISNPQNREEAVGKLLEAYGGKLVSYHLLLNGGIDFFIVSDIPDDRIADVALVNAMLVRGSGVGCNRIYRNSACNARERCGAPDAKSPRDGIRDGV